MQKQIVTARIRVDADYKKEKIDCDGESGCIRAAQKKYNAALKDISKQQIDASAENDICRTQEAAGAPSGQPGSPGNPLQGYISNDPAPPDNRPHSPFYYMNNALNDAVSHIPGGERQLQQAGQAASQVDKTINQGLNDAARQTEEARKKAADEFIQKWTHPMSPQQAAGEVASAWAGNAAGAGAAAGAGSLLKGGAANAMTKGAVAKAGSAAMKAATEEAAVTAGAGSAVGRGLGGATTPRGAPEENAPAAPAALKKEVEEIERSFARDFDAKYGSNAPGLGEEPLCINACFYEAEAQARLWAAGENYVVRGVQNLGKSDMAATGEEIKVALKTKFGGQAAAGNPAFTPAEVMAQEQGIPIPASPDRIKAIVEAGHNGNQWLIFTKPPQGMGHVFNGRFENNVAEFVDVQQQLGHMWFTLTENTFFIYQLY